MLTADQKKVIDQIEPHQITPKLLRRIDKTLVDEVLADAIIDGEVDGLKADYLREALPANCTGLRRMERAIDRMSVQIGGLVKLHGALIRLLEHPMVVLPAAPPAPDRVAPRTPPQPRRGHADVHRVGERAEPADE